MYFLINNFYTITHGILASTATFLFFTLFGIVLLPQKIFELKKSPLRPPFSKGGIHAKDFNATESTKSREKNSGLLINFDLDSNVHPFEKGGCRGNFLINTCFSFVFGLAGLAAFCIVCFYSLQFNISLYTVFQCLSLILVSIFIIRFALAKENTTNLFLSLILYLKKSHILEWWLIYISFYTLVYIFLPQPDPSQYIPVNHIGNTDVFNYINITQDLLFLKDSTLANTYIHPFHLPYSDPFWAYYQTPGVYYFNAWMSLFYGDNAMNASMPILYTTVSLIGLMITYYCHYFFRCSRIISAGIAAIILCGSFYRFIIGFYFLSSLMGTVLWLACIISILQWDYEQKANKNTFIHFFFSITIPSLLLLLFYPIFFWINLFLITGIIALTVLYEKRPFSFRHFFSYFGYMLLSIGLVFALVPQSISFSIHSILFQASRSQVLWVLPLLSPLAILGFPTYYGWLGSKALLALFTIVICSLFYCFYRLHLKKASNQEKAPIYILCLLAIGALCAYWFYYYMAGPLRYQPWKFASYFILPLAGVFWASFFKTLSYTKYHQRIFAGFLILCLAGNFFFYYYQLPQPPNKTYQKLALLDGITGSTLATKMNNFTGTYLARFFIRHKQLHSLNYSYYSRESLANIKDTQPFFVESSHGCSFTSLSKEAFPIHPIGCLYFGIPILAFNTHYHFIDNLPFIETHGLFEFFADSPLNKRWEGATASITFYFKKSILKKHPHGYFHFEVAPFTQEQRAYISWGKNHHTLITISSQTWLNLPYNEKDWSLADNSRQLKTITFKFRLPDAKSPHELNNHSNDMRQRSLDFIQFFISQGKRIYLSVPIRN